MVGFRFFRAAVRSDRRSYCVERKRGKWDAAIKMWLGEGKPQEFKGEEDNKPAGELGTASAIEGEFLGQEIVGQGIFGYDPENRKYVGVWVDSSEPSADRWKGLRLG